MIKNFLRLLIVGVAIFMILKFSTFGWKFFGLPRIDFSRNSALADKLKSHVYELSQNIGNRDIYYPDKLDSAARYIVEQFKKYGYEVSFQEFIVAVEESRDRVEMGIHELRVHLAEKSEHFLAPEFRSGCLCAHSVDQNRDGLGIP